MPVGAAVEDEAKALVEQGPAIETLPLLREIGGKCQLHLPVLQELQSWSRAAASIRDGEKPFEFLDVGDQKVELDCVRQFKPERSELPSLDLGGQRSSPERAFIVLLHQRMHALASSVS